jgi:hypothetical protein
MPRPSSLGRAALDRLVKQYGREKVAEWLRDHETRVKRTRGRPKGPKYNDTPLIQAAAARWRRAGGRRHGGGDVWPFLREVAGSESATRRLLRRLDEWGAEGCDERGIADFNAALWSARFARALGGAVDSYKDWALHILAAGYRHRYSIEATDAEVLFRSLPDFAAHLDAAFASCSTSQDAWAAVRHLSARRFYC